MILPACALLPRDEKSVLKEDSHGDASNSSALRIVQTSGKVTQPEYGNVIYRCLARGLCGDGRLDRKVGGGLQPTLAAYLEMLGHSWLRSQLEELVDGELDDDAVDKVRIHVLSCGSCSSEVHTLRMLKAALAHLA